MLTKEDVKKRLQRYEGASCYEENGVLKIEYRGVVMHRERIYDLWEMFKRFNKKKLRNKDHNYISPISKGDKPVNDYYEEFKGTEGKSIDVKYLLYNDHISGIKGTIIEVDSNMITISTDSGMRYIGYKEIVEIKYIR